MIPDYTSDWVTWHVPDWLRWLAPWIGQADVHLLEIGSYEGRSANWFCDNVLTGPRSYCVCVDTWTNEGTEARFTRNTTGRPIHRRKGTSSLVLPQLAVERRRYQIAYVDGDHSAARTLADLCAVWDLLTPGALLIADDYGWTSPDRPIPPQPAIDAFLTCYADRIARHEIRTHQAAIWTPR